MKERTLIIAAQKVGERFMFLTKTGWDAEARDLDVRRFYNAAHAAKSLRPEEDASNIEFIDVTWSWENPNKPTISDVKPRAGGFGVDIPNKTRTGFRNIYGATPEEALDRARFQWNR